MRDIIMILAFMFLLLPAVKKPFIAVSLWLWTALFFPNGWVYGFAGSIRYNLIFSLLTIGGILFVRERPKLEFNALTLLISVFLFWATLSYFAGMGDPDLSKEYWIKFIKVIALYYCASYILSKKLHIDFFVWAIVLSVGFYATVEGLKLIASGGGHHIAGISGHELGDRNDLALAIDMAIPLVSYLIGEAQSKNVKLGLVGVLVLMVLCVLGTYSRGGLIGLLVLYGAYLKESRHKIIILLALVVIGYLGSNLMPEEWFNRMDTIQNADQDASFMGRVVAWKISTLIALDHPVLGGGIKSLEYYPVWLSYALELNDKLTFINTPPPDLSHAHAAHSIFFQALGDMGFVGLFLFLGIIFTAYRKLVKMAFMFRENLPYRDLSKMLKLSLIMYVVVAAAASKVYFDLFYAICALVRVLERRYVST